METGFEVGSRVETTVGELVEAITQIALESGSSEQDGYQLAALTIDKILEQKKDRLSLIQENY